MSRRTREYIHCKRESVEDTTAAILYRHRTSRNTGRRYFVDQYDATALVTDGKNIIFSPSSLPIKPEKAERIAQALHARRA